MQGGSFGLVARVIEERSAQASAGNGFLWMNQRRPDVKPSFIAACAVALSMLAGGMSGSALAQSVAPSTDSPDFYKAAEAYCIHTGGIVETRVAVYGSNGQKLLFLAGERDFCQYTAKDGSRIHLLLTTLFAERPTLAALAYYSKLPMGSCQGNPASCYCTLLGGSDQFGGTTGAGGGWYLKGAIDETLEACIFPDMSSIDSWGLAYHSAGIIRGKNLAKVLRFKNPY
jgi:hypothetical protein